MCNVSMGNIIGALLQDAIQLLHRTSERHKCQGVLC